MPRLWITGRRYAQAQKVSLETMSLTDPLQAREGEEALSRDDRDESLLDLISTYGREAAAKGEAKGAAEKPRTGKAGKGSK